MIKFIYGNPGTGKTEMIYSDILNDVRNNQKVILIVPEQFTVAAERDIINKIPPSGQLFVEVLNFTRLANRLFRIYGGISYNFISKAHEKLLMWQAIKTALPFLREYQMLSADDYSLTDAMLATYKELSASGISLEQIEEVADNSNNNMLSSKIKDIAAVCSIYHSILDDKFSDTNSELLRLVSLLQNNTCLTDTKIYIDGFTSFTGIEHNIIKEIMNQANSVSITVGIPSPSYNGIDTLSIKECSDKLRRDCASLGAKAETVILRSNYRTSSYILSTISSDLWMMDKSDTDKIDKNDDNSVELYKACDIYDECEFAAAKIRELVEHGYRYKDIAIIARNIDKYRGIIEPSLENMEIKYFISEKTDLSVSPIAKFILSAIKALSRGWQRTDIISHIKSGLCGISSHDADIFEYYTAKWNITGKSFLTEEPWNMNPDGYTSVRSERGTAILEIANNVRVHLIGNLRLFTSKLKAAQSYKEMCTATYEYLELLNIRETMLNLSKEYLEAGKIREASDCARMYEVALDALDCVCDAFSENEKPDINTFATALRIAFSESDLGSIPTSQDEVILGSANLLRTDNIKCTVILGACDGEFPATAEACGLFNKNDRKYLIKQGIQITGNEETSSADELYYFRRAVSAPSEKLIVFSRGDSEPSIAFTRLQNIISDITVKDTSNLLLPRLRTMKSVSEYASLLSGTNEGEALKLLTSDFTDKNTDIQNISVTAESDHIDDTTLQMVFGREISLTQTKAELFLNCKFAYSCKYHLNLDDGKRAEFSFNSIGIFIHHILEKFLYRVYIVNKGKVPEEDEIINMVDEIIDKYLAELLPDNKIKNARLIHLIQRLKTSSVSIIIDMLNELSDSSFKPEFFELRIGTKEIPSVKITLNNGSRISINGIVDRVDIFRKDGNSYIRVVDYKTGNKVFSISDIQEGLNLQMVLYIYSLTNGNKELLSKIFGGTPVAAGVTYISADSSKPKSSRISNNNYDNSVNIKRSGLILNDDDVINAVSKTGNDKILMKSARKNSFIDKDSFSLLFEEVCTVLRNIGDEMISGNVNASPKLGGESCQYCRYASICRTSQKGNG